MSVILGAANAYLGLRAGVTSHLSGRGDRHNLRTWKGTVLEETWREPPAPSANRLPALSSRCLPSIAGSWTSFDPAQAYWKSTALMVVGGILRAVRLLVRRAMVEDPEPFPESVAASEIRKAGQQGAEAARYLFWNIGQERWCNPGELHLFAVDKDFFRASADWAEVVGWSARQHQRYSGRSSVVSAPTVSPRSEADRLVLSRH
jgi:hypothetical protein